MAVARAPLHSNGGPFPGVQIKNNLANREFRGIGPEAVQEKNLINVTNDFYVDATNPDLTKRNYSLREGSAAIDAGVDVAPFNAVLKGAPDLGAYEFGMPMWTAGAGTAEAKAAACCRNEVKAVSLRRQCLPVYSRVGTGRYGNLNYEYSKESPRYGKHEKVSGPDVAGRRLFAFRRCAFPMRRHRAPSIISCRKAALKP
jgi:hypothetical protein